MEMIFKKNWNNSKCNFLQNICHVTASCWATTSSWLLNQKHVTKPAVSSTSPSIYLSAPCFIIINHLIGVPIKAPQLVFRTSNNYEKYLNFEDDII